MRIPCDAVRIFIGSAALPVPGFIVRPGAVALPLLLDGRMREIPVDTTSIHPATVQRRLEETIADHKFPSFVNRTNKFTIYPTAREFETRHRPPWIATIADRATAVIDAYAAGEGRIVSAHLSYDLLGLLQISWQRLGSYLGSLLYMGIPGDGIPWFERLSYTFASPPLTDSASDMLFLMRALNLIDIDYHRKLKPLYGTSTTDNMKFEEFFEDGDFSQIEAEVIEEGGMRNQVVMKSQDRPVEIMVRDDNGNISQQCFRMSTPIADRMLNTAFADTGALMGMFVCAAFNVTIDEILAIFQREGHSPDQVVAEFLMSTRGVDRSAAADAATPMTAVLGSLFIRNLRGNPASA